MTKSLRIAVADDEPDIRDYFQRILPHLGHEVVATASNGRELLQLCREKKPDLIIADVRMPDMDGDAAIAEICRETPTPFILISAHSKPTQMLDGCNGVGRAYLTKPMKRSELEAAIQQVRPTPAT